MTGNITPGPWYAQGAKIKADTLIYVADCVRAEDAAYIVDVCNADQRLVGWRPIETAVQDGKPVLICGGTYRYDADCYPEDMPFVGVKIAHWHKGQDEWNGGYGSAFDGEYWHKPTHWMPLPPAPSSDTETSQ